MLASLNNLLRRFARIDWNSLPLVAPGKVKRRLGVLCTAFALLFLAILGRVISMGFEEGPEVRRAGASIEARRPEIIDRNGKMLGLNYPSASVFVEPRRIIDIDEAAEGLVGIFPDLDIDTLRKRLSSGAGFAWVKRNVTPAERDKVWSLGLPGVYLQNDIRRFYPNGRLAAHILGGVNVDNTGIAGIEKWIDQANKPRTADSQAPGDVPVALSIDMRAQYILADELGRALLKFGAIGAAGLIMDVTNGEVIAMTSLPDFDPNIPGDALKPDRINRMSVGTYEMGSTFKALTTAMALESSRYTVRAIIDATQPLRLGGFSITDYRGKKRPLSIPEAFIYSSNIVMAKMALELGAERQRSFLRQIGQFDRLTTELPETASPQVPARWGDTTTATVAFGHGIAVTPLQASMAIASVINGGTLIRPTFIKGADVEERILARGVVSPTTGEALRFLMRLNAQSGSAVKANIPGYYVGGKTGTSEKVVGGRYSGEKVLTAFMGVAPSDKPRYLFMAILDEPQPLPETFGFRTSGWNAVPTTGKIMERVLPLLSMPPYRSSPAQPFPRMTSAGAWGIDQLGLLASSTGTE